MIRFLFSCLALLVGAFPAVAAPRDHLKQPDDWFRSPVGRERLENVLSWQDAHGAWPKNLDTSGEPFRGDPNGLKGTFDNSATVNELRLLARAFQVTKKDAYQSAFLKGVQCILDAQYENGGWPQGPNAKGYSQYITFNDGTMVGLMTFLREAATEERYAFVPAETRRKASEAFDRGIECILACQIEVDGKRTAWCAQHDPVTLEPRGARIYEHPSLSGAESAGIVCLLTSLDDPSEEVQASIRAAVAWFEKSKLTGIRFEERNGDGRVVPDPDAPPLWARFYEIETGRPIFSGRDGVVKYDIAEIEPERRNGYAWYGTWGERVEKCWANWKAK